MAVKVFSPDTYDACRRPEIMADAAHAILTRPSRECTGNFFLDDDVLREEGMTDEQIEAYWMHPTRRSRTSSFLEYDNRSEEHTSELQSLMRISYAVFCLKKQTT